MYVIERRDDMEWIHELFQQYGYYVVLVGLLLEYI
ncbi:DedA family protein, partial [Bacillus wiedmannii]